MVVGMSLLVMFIVGANVVVLTVVTIALSGRRPARVVIPVVALVVFSAVLTFAAARSLGRLEVEWDQFNEDPSSHQVIKISDSGAPIYAVAPPVTRSRATPA